MNLPPPPQDAAAEEHLLGAMLIAPTAIDAAGDAGVQPTDFYRPSHGVIFSGCIAMYLADEPVDPITLCDWLDSHGTLDTAGGRDRVHELAMIVPAASNAGHYAKIVRETSALRSLIRAGQEIQQLGQERPGELAVLIERAEKLIFDLALTGRSRDFVSISDIVGETFRKLEELNKSGREIVGLPTGFRQLDTLTSGLQPGNLVVLAARPSMGKTALALGIAAHVALPLGLPVALFTLEMGEQEVMHRLLSVEGLVESQKLRNGKLDSEEWSRVVATTAKLHRSRFFIDDTGDLTMLELRAKARRLRMRNPDLALVIVDYLQLLTSGGPYESRVQDVSAISRALKVLAGELRVPVLALSQLNRSVETRHDKRPILSDLRESGSIEQDSDVVAFLYRDEYYNPEETDLAGIAELNLAKHRNGPTGTVKLSWVKRYTRFSDLPL